MSLRREVIRNQARKPWKQATKEFGKSVRDKDGIMHKLTISFFIRKSIQGINNKKLTKTKK